MNLSLSVALSLFMFLEFIRVSKLWLLSPLIQSFFDEFLDHRDRLGSAILSHIYLLIGCALPIWLSKYATTLFLNLS